MHTKQSFQTLRDELEAVKRNLTGNPVRFRNCLKSLYCDLFNFDSCPKCEYGWEQHGRQCYYFSTNYLTWSESRDECRQKGGDLVQIDSREDEKMNFDDDMFWIGLTDSEKEGTWLWVDGSLLNESLTFWNGSEPDNWTVLDPDGEDCVRMGEKTGAPDLKCWFDFSCNASYRSICEKPAETGHFKLS
uniref:C-type lectin domain-containing protein n=1 Tax=Dicentrarchus labrax TaxID=13489 RepID=A0A8C4HNB9_DICLA